MAKAKRNAALDTEIAHHLTQRWGGPNTAQSAYGFAHYKHSIGKGSKPNPKKYGLAGFGGKITASDIRGGINRRIYAGGSLDKPQQTIFLGPGEQEVYDKGLGLKKASTKFNAGSHAASRKSFYVRTTHQGKRQRVKMGKRH